jgi:hypothetical protein
VEKEMNTFDRYDTTSRIQLVQQYPSPSSVTSPYTTASSSRQISLEYDSAKLNTNIDNIDNDNDRSTITMTGHKRSNNNTRRRNNGQYLAPTMSMQLQTSLFHPRLMAHVTKTWIMSSHNGNGGGDSINRRYSSILERYSNSIPKSIIVHSSIHSTPSSSSAAAAAAAGGGGGEGYKKKLITWLENDGWKPQKMSVNLLGNISTRNEIGLLSPSPIQPIPLTTKNSRQSLTTIPSWPIIHDMGIRLR